MRDFLNSILSFISAESLTDEEFETVLATDEEYNQATYEDLERILASRDGVSDAQERLKMFYELKGYAATPATGKSNIFIGSEI